MNWINYIVSILSGLAIAIPLIVKLVEYVEKAIKEKNWNKLLDLIINLMQEAEEKFDNGATRKEWVLAMVKSSADSINYNIDLDEVGNLIDSLCDMSKIVNKSESGEKVGE